MKNHEKIMLYLAERLDLTWDGPKDIRLFTNDSSARTLHLSKKEYEAMEKKLSKFEIKGNGFTCYAWNDCSGYDYWTKNQKEDNYIQITVAIENPEIVNLREIHDAVELAEEEFSDYRPDWYTGCRNFTPSNVEKIKDRLCVE